jgi:hypothetical protein
MVSDRNNAASEDSPMLGVASGLAVFLIKDNIVVDVAPARIIIIACYRNCHLLYSVSVLFKYSRLENTIKSVITKHTR